MQPLTNVIAIPVTITRQGQQVFTEVAVPDDVLHIRGIECSATAMNGITAAEITGRQPVGTFRLQAAGIASRCYSAEAYTGTGDIEKWLPGFDPAYTAWQQNDFTGGKGREPDAVSISTHYLYVLYTDMIGKRMTRDIGYTAMLYLWTERKDEP